MNCFVPRAAHVTHARDTECDEDRESCRCRVSQMNVHIPQSGYEELPTPVDDSRTGGYGSDVTLSNVCYAVVGYNNRHTGTGAASLDIHNRNVDDCGHL